MRTLKATALPAGIVLATLAIIAIVCLIGTVLDQQERLLRLEQHVTTAHIYAVLANNRLDRHAGKGDMAVPPEQRPQKLPSGH